MLENAQTSDPEQEAFMLPESIDGKRYRGDREI